VEILGLLLEAGARIEGDPRCDKPPLNMALYRGKLASVRFLLSKKADVNAISQNGSLALTESMQVSGNEANSQAMIEELLRAGAPINARDLTGQTALMRAVQLKFTNICAFLLSRGADPRITDLEAKTALDFVPAKGPLRKTLAAAAARLTTPIPPPVFVRSGLWTSPYPFWIGKDARVGRMDDRWQVVDVAGKVLAWAPSPPRHRCLEKSINASNAHLLDLDSDGIRDVSYLDNDCDKPDTFFLYITVHGGKTTFLVNYDGRGRLSGSVPITPGLRAPLVAELQRRAAMSRDEIEHLLAAYTLMVDTTALAAVQKLHAEALRLHKAHKPARAVELLAQALAPAAVSKLDPTGADETVTELLNDHGFLLSEAGLHQRAIAVLQSVIARAPDRAVAYLNLADAEHALGDAASASLHYRRYATLMWSADKGAKIPGRVTERMARQ
jgi:uncharacterized small protein (DUF1192 family)